MKNKIWFTADLHLGHSNIIKHCNRPFSNVDQMDDYLINRWNSVVAPDDTVFVLGDVGYYWERYLPRMKGRKVLIIGNHDRKPISKGGLSFFDSSHDYLELDIHPQRWILCHYPIFEWNAIFRGSYHLHGHTHGSVTEISGRIMDVGTDCQKDFTPWSSDQIISIMEKKPIRQPPQKSDEK